jgi:hypothetical protein
VAIVSDVMDFMDLTFKLETFVRENDKSLR